MGGRRAQLRRWILASALCARGSEGGSGAGEELVSEHHAGFLALHVDVFVPGASLESELQKQSSPITMIFLSDTYERCRALAVSGGTQTPHRSVQPAVSTRTVDHTARSLKGTGGLRTRAGVDRARAQAAQMCEEGLPAALCHLRARSRHPAWRGPSRRTSLFEVRSRVKPTPRRRSNRLLG